ncbi:hypothetical protein ACFQZS_11140 [Mucilaginibacter calamicampi]|uniref:Uncharacterized protein n=1 Tax=Mucilaginibacter calamicampi TaxID=1302352 RepID=A0ABW2YW62_9SPHI
MMRWFVYIVLFLLIAPTASSAKLINSAAKVPPITRRYYVTHNLPLADTIIKKHPPDEDEKNKIKEISKAKRQSKPEKIDNAGNQPKPQRERRPEGMERPPEIPRRNGN